MATYATVGSFPSRPMAELAVTYLNANGIGAIVWADDAGGTYPHMALFRGITLRVHEEDAEAARELLAEAEAATVAEPDPEQWWARPVGPRPVITWVVRLAAVAVVGLIAVTALPPR